jgi:MSHA biogenesis protein MshJ
MKKAWQQLRDRIDGAVLRERIMIFGASAIALVFLANLLLIEPTLTRHRRVAKEIAQRQTEIASMQEQIRKIALGRQNRPDRMLTERLDGIKQKIGEIEKRVAQEQRNLVPPDQVAPVLEHLLSRNRNLALVELRSLPVINLAQKAKDAPTPAKQAEGEASGGVNAGNPVAGVYRHGVEITLTGNYADLLSYLKDLEALPRQLYWGQFDLRVNDYPQLSLKLSVYTLSLDRVWMVV